MSEFTAVLNAPNTEVREALATCVPEVAGLSTALTRCRQELTVRQAQLDNVPRGHGSLVADLAQALVDGDALPPDFGERANANAQQVAALQAERALLLSVAGRLENDRDLALRGAVDALLRHLDGRVRQIVTDARNLTLQGARDADQAIEVGAVTEWTRYAALRSSYFAVRQGQAALTDHGYNQHADTFALLDNYADLHPTWLRERKGHGRSLVVGQSGAYALPWPTEPVEQFSWLVHEPAAEPWVPTPGELQAAYRSAYQVALADLEDERPRPFATPSERQVDRTMRIAAANA